MEVSGQDWFSISAWGQKNADLKDWEVGLAASLGALALAGWKKAPSVKQAKHGVRILKLAADEFSRDLD
jgi:hypothetical protein